MIILSRIWTFTPFDSVLSGMKVNIRLVIYHTIRFLVFNYRLISLLFDLSMFLSTMDLLHHWPML